MIETGLLALLGLLLTIIILRRGELGVYLLMAVTPVEDVFVIGGFTSGIKVLTGLTVASLMLKAYSDPETRVRVNRVLRNKTFLLALAFTVWAFLSVVWAIYPAVALSKSVRFLGVTVLAMLMGVLSRRQMYVAWGILIASSVLSVLQGLAGGGFNALNNRFVAEGQDPNEYAGLLIIMTVMLLIGFRPFRWWKLIPAAILLAGALLTQSRSGLISLVIAPALAMLILAVIRQIRLKALVQGILAYVALAGAAILTLSAFPTIQENLFARASTLQNYSSNDTWAGRLDIWQGGIKMWLEHPLLGVGAGNFSVLSPNYSFQAAQLYNLVGAGVAHNSYLSNLAEMGVMGLFLFLGLLWMMFSRAAKQSLDSAFSRAIFICSIIFIILAFSLSLEYSKILYILLGTQIALLLHRSSEKI